MEFKNWQLWLKPIEEITCAEVMAFEIDKGWLYGENNSLSMVFLELLQKGNLQTSELFSSLHSVAEKAVWIGVSKKSEEIDHLLALLEAYLKNDRSPLTRQDALRLLLTSDDEVAIEKALTAYFKDSDQKVWLWIESPKGQCADIVTLFDNLGHRNVLHVSNSRLGLLMYLQIDDEVEEHVEGIHRLIEEELFESVHIGISQVFTHIADLGQAAEAAECALEACTSIIGSQSWYFVNKDLLPILLANPSKQKKILASIDKRGIRLFLEDKELVYTLECFYKANLNTSEAAGMLFIHRNTLIYRLNKIEKMTHLDPRRFFDAMNLFAMIVVENRGDRV